ncbi:arginyltransferase [Nitrosomonas sp. Nm33]|uniref:arginyltransferase n=1 Tax=Nitrosomonas sp. Nm33 TaxID=133724 RepID=UPI00089C746D|nr:arginyltransferase [Nitrosomonas sp. Nm33]SDY57435.1 arginine-tRNA-protein transferase [Nitrosomonas sp. Nm33]
MSIQNDAILPVMKFHTTEFYPCSYLPSKLARSQIVLPDHLIDAPTYAQLIKIGFRRSGNFVYRPNCEQCEACVPVRIIVDQFSSNRAQRRAWRQHQHLVATHHKLHYHPDHYRLYRRYQVKRHANGGMDYDSRDQYCNFLLQSNVDSRLITFHENDQLRMISIVDQLPDGLSSVYTFYDPDVSNASFGTFNILWQIEQCRIKKLPFLYLGYWIGESRKMSYKANFQPLQILQDGQWQTFNNPSLQNDPIDCPT